MKKILLLALLVFSICTTTQAQPLEGQAMLDSLLAELPKAKKDTNKVQLLRSITISLRHINPEEGLQYGLQGVELAEQLEWDRGVMLCKMQIGSIHSATGNYADAMKCYTESLNLASASKDSANIAYAYGNMANVKNREGDYPKALEFYLTTLHIQEQLNDKLIPNTMENIGVLYYYLEKYPKTLEYFEQAQKSYGEKGDKASLAGIALNIGNVYLDGYKDYPKALEYYTLSRKLAEEIGNKAKFANATVNIGSVYNAIKDYKTSLSYFKSALQLLEELGDKKGEAMDLLNIGQVYLRIAKAGGIPNTVSKTSEVPIADVPAVRIPEGRTALLAEAEKYSNLALELATEMGDLSRIETSYKQLSEIYELQGNYKKSLAAHKEYLVYKDSLFNTENTAKIAKLEVKAEYEKIQLADSIQNAEAQKLAAVKLSRQRTFTVGGVGAAILLLAFSLFVFRNNKKLGVEKEKSEELLHNILPAEVASELKDRGATTAQHYNHVTVLFTDFVNFTQAGERMGSQALVEELHNCFEAFDGIMDKYGIEKIKTIGDAYLAVCGLPTADEHHAEKVVSAAQDIRAFMLSRFDRLGDKTFEVRIGVHSGEVVAGIVGVKKFAYDIWGDTVNTAARMESNSEAGKINISQTTYELVQNQFTCTYRGEIEAKGKGMLKMYYVEA